MLDGDAFFVWTKENLYLQVNSVLRCLVVE